MAKEKKPLIPTIERKDIITPEEFFNNLPDRKETNVNEQINDIIEKEKKAIDEADTFFRQMGTFLTTDKDIDLKTEYVNEDEQFTGSKLQFLVNECGFRTSKDFLPIWERKRVSLMRKGRIDSIQLMQKRNEEKEAQDRKEQYKKDVNM